LGLVREEIAALRWEQVDLPDREVRLPDRTVPLPEALAAFLSSLAELRGRSEGPVVLSDRDALPLAPQSISRLARLALDRAGQTKIRLIDLRHDFVLSTAGGARRALRQPDLRHRHADAPGAFCPVPAAKARPAGGSRGAADAGRGAPLARPAGGGRLRGGAYAVADMAAGPFLQAVAGLKWEQVDLAAGTLQASAGM
jgi:hypothetical protein